MALNPALKTQQMQIGGMDCTSCKMKIEGKLERLKGVDEASVRELPENRVPVIIELGVIASA
jgi:copper chaperone CopZ